MTTQAPLTQPSLFTAQIDALNDEAWDIRDTQQEHSRTLMAESQGLSEEHAYALGLARSLTVSSYHHYRQGRFDKVIEEASIALPLLELHEDFWLPRIYNNLGLTYGDIGKTTLGMEYLLKQLESSQKLGDKWLEGTAYHDLSFLFDEPSKTIEYLNRGLSLFREAGDEVGVELALINLGNSYLEKKDYEAANQHIYQALELAKGQQLSWETYAYQTLGLVEFAQEHYEAALQRFELALPVAKERERAEEPKVLLNIGKCYLHLQPEHALPYLQEALAACERLGNKAFLPQCHTELVEAYKQLGDFGKALYHFEQFHHHKEAIFNEESEQKKRALLVMHQTELAKKEAQAQQRKNAELSRYIHELETLHQQVKELSIRDPLTGLYNRRYLFEYLATLSGTASVALMDIDHFKRINDSYSHQVGDEVLKGVASFLNASVRGADIAARYGGEEFILVFPNTKVEQAHIACERVRIALAHHTWSKDYADLQVTVSIGLAVGNIEDQSLFTKADRKLYEAKRTGRNCVVY
jgi:diguanylate cyclase (GGDEF)-like protein